MRNRRTFWLYCLAVGVRVTGVAGEFRCGRFRAGCLAARLTYRTLLATFSPVCRDKPGKNGRQNLQFGLKVLPGPSLASGMGGLSRRKARVRFNAPSRLP